MIKIRRLVGDITEQNLKYVECYVAERLGIFIPSVGFCEYAITPSHTHPSYSFVLFFSKEDSFFEKNIDLPQEHYLTAVISPGVPHEERPAENFKRYMAIVIDRQYFEGIYQKYDFGIPEYKDWKQFAVHHEIMLLIKKFMDEYINRIIGYESILEALSEIISHCLIRSILKIQTGESFASDRFEIENIIHYMQQHFAEKITIEELAKKVRMSESNFIRVFKKDTGLTPMDYLIGIRIEKAKKLLMAGTKNITEISLLCGFSSTSHFSYSFSKHTGISPSKYREIMMRRA